jgi:hypothetical protein
MSNIQQPRDIIIKAAIDDTNSAKNHRDFLLNAMGESEEKHDPPEPTEISDLCDHSDHSTAGKFRLQYTRDLPTLPYSNAIGTASGTNQRANHRTNG